MELFPENLTISYPIGLSDEFRTLITDFDSNKEQRRKRWAFSKRHLNVGSKTLSLDSIKDLWQFYRARSGAFEAFYFYVPGVRYCNGELVGRGDDSQVIFDMPAKETDDTTLTAYVDGVETAVTFISGGGQAGSDRIQFAAAPALGAVITADFKGRLLLKARFAADKLDDELFSYLLYNVALPIVEVK